MITRALLTFSIMLCLTFIAATTLVGQSIPTGSLSGTVKDPTGAYVSSATVVVKNTGTNAEYTTQTSDNGTFTVPSLTQGIYTVTVSAAGFKQTIAQNVKVDVAKTSDLEVTLEVGQVSESVVIAGGAEVLRTTETNISSTISGRQIVELPFATRDALQLVLVQPGTQTATVPRASTINGLPKGSLNITLDGINVQDNLLKSSDGFFTSTQAKADAVAEMTVSSATPGAESSAGGASQIRFVTKAGTNEFHGGAFWQHRNTALNANYYFNNIDGLDRDRMLLNQAGGHIGGPIWKDRAFFFFNYEEFRLPQTYPAARTILTDLARTGVYTYVGSKPATVPTGCVAISDTQMRCTRNVLTLAANRNAQGLPASVRPYATTIDPIVGNLLSLFSQGAANGGTLKSRIESANDHNRLDLNFQAPGTNIRRFPTARFDWDVTKKHHFEFTYHYQQYFSDPDAVNSQLPVVPGAGIVLGADSKTTGSIIRNAFSFAGALRSTLSSNLINEARYTLGNGGISIFGSEATSALFTGRRGYTLSFPIGSNPQTRSTQSRRHTPVTTIYDNLTWIKGTHSFNFGGTFTHVKGYQQSQGSETIPTATFGIAAGDPVNTNVAASGQPTTVIFSTTNFPGSSSGQRTEAAALYALLTGRISSFTNRATLDEENKQFTFTPFEEHNYQNELGFFFQDSWRFRPNLTINYGVRWEIDFAPRNKNGVYTTAGYESVFGVSGVGNLFKPGVFGNTTLPQFNLVDEKTKPYKTRYNDFAPSFGIAWTPDLGSKAKLLKTIFGSAGQTVFRGGYSIAYVREGFDTFYSMWGLNPGPFLSLSVSPANNPTEFRSEGFSGPGSVLFRDPVLPRRLPPSQATFPITAGPGEDFNEWSPNLRMGYVQSWSLGIQRELTKNMALEIRYVGNHGTKLWRQYELNEVNIFENGFLDEFKIAQENLRLSRLANPSPTSANFNNFGFQAGVAGTRPIPIIATALATSNDEGFATTIRRGLAGTLASNIALNNTRMGRLMDAKLVPFVTLTDGTRLSNFFIVNPLATNGSYLVTNDGHSTYNALQVELRRRLSKGFLIDASYTFAKSLSNMFSNSSSVFSQPTTLRDLAYDKGPSPFDLRQAFKINGIYELPIGPGRRWLNFNMPVVSKLLEGWQIGGVARIQSGTPLRITGGRLTFNNNVDGKDNGVILYNMTRDQLQSMVKIEKTPGGVVFFLPQDLINNSLAAFEVAGAPTHDPAKPYIGPPSTPGQLGARIFLYGPWQKKIDFNILKKTRITERVNMEFRAQFLNAFNYQNFFAGTVNSTNSPILADGGIGSQFGQTRSAYRDVTVSGTNDPGGRLIEFQLRFNF